MMGGGCAICGRRVSMYPSNVKRETANGEIVWRGRFQEWICNDCIENAAAVAFVDGRVTAESIKEATLAFVVAMQDDRVETVGDETKWLTRHDSLVKIK